MQHTGHGNVAGLFGVHTEAPAPGSAAQPEQSAPISSVRLNPHPQEPQKHCGEAMQHRGAPSDLCTASHRQK